MNQGMRDEVFVGNGSVTPRSRMVSAVYRIIRDLEGIGKIRNVSKIIDFIHCCHKEIGRIHLFCFG